MAVPITLVFSEHIPPPMRALMVEHARILERNGIRVEAVALSETPGSTAGVPLPMREVSADDRATALALLASRRGPAIAFDAASALLLSEGAVPRSGYLVLDFEPRWNTEPDEVDRAVASYRCGVPLRTTSPWVARQVGEASGVSPVCDARVALHLATEAGPSDRPCVDVVIAGEGSDPARTRLLVTAARRAVEVSPGVEVGAFGAETLSLVGVPHQHFGASSDDVSVASALRAATCYLAVPDDELAIYRILQAMSFGCCVVAPRSASIEDVCHSGQDCLLVDETSPEAMSEALVRILSDTALRESLSSGAREAASGFEASAYIAALLGWLDPERCGTDILVARDRALVSVVIPSKNAGGDFRHTMQKLREAQQDFDVEIVVIDSGSDDQTVSVAREHGATVAEIPPEEFRHGETRHRGALMASGDYLLLMTQDVIPIGSDWLSRLMRPLLEDTRVVASHARDIPRTDADVFGCWIVRNAYRGRAWSADELVGGDGVDVRKLDPSDKRRYAQLTDSCCLLRSDVFREFGFSDVSYGEDLDLGYRLLVHGYRLAHLHSVGVVHSHNRSAYYFLRRTYVDAVVVPRILEFPRRRPVGVPLGVVTWSIRDLYSCVKGALGSCRLEGASNTVFEELLNALARPALPRIDFDDEELDRWVGSLPHTQYVGEPGNNVFKHAFLGSMADFAGYYSETYPTTLGHEAEVRESVYKVFGTIVAAVLGSLVTDDPQLAADLVHVDAELRRGV